MSNSVLTARDRTRSRVTVTLFENLFHGSYGRNLTAETADGERNPFPVGLSGPGHNYGNAPRVARRPAGKA